MFNSPLEQFSIIPIKRFIIEIFYGLHDQYGNNESWFHYELDLSFTIVSIYMIINLFVILFLLLLSIKNGPFFENRWLMFMKFLMNFVGGSILQQTGKANSAFIPYFLTTFLFILASNLIGLLPYGFTITAQLIITFFLAISFNIGFLFLSFKIQGIKFLRFFVPKNVPILFIPLITVIEIISYILRSISLSVRLFANMLAGHSLLHILISFCFVMNSVLFSFIPWALGFFIVMLEFAIALIQAYVFFILLCIYLNDALGGSSH